MNRILFAGTLTVGMLIGGMTLSAQEEIVPGIAVLPNGMLEIGKATMEIQHFGEGYTLAGQSGAVEQTTLCENGAFALSVPFRTSDGGMLDLTEKVQQAEDGSVLYFAVMKSATGISTEELSLAFTLPVADYAEKTLTASGKTLLLPKDYLDEKSFLGWFPDVAELLIPMPDGKTLHISSPSTFSFLAQDNRKWQNPHNVVRIRFTPTTPGKLLTEGGIKLKFALK